MFGLPLETDLSFLANQVLVQVCLGRHDLHLNFDGGASVRIESYLEVFDAKGETSKFIDFARSASQVAALLDCRLIQARAASNGTLIIEFQNRSKLHIYDSNDAHESYVIRYRGVEIIV